MFTQTYTQHTQLGKDDGQDALATWPAAPPTASSSNSSNGGGGPLSIESAFCTILDHLAHEGLSQNQLTQLR